MDAFIVDAVRSPRGQARATGALTGVKPVHLLAQMYEALAARTGIDTSAVEDAVIGCVSQSGEQGSNIGKIAALYAGWSPSMSAATINRFCSSGLSAVSLAALQAAAADGLAVGGGVEMMSRVPMFSDNGAWRNDPEIAEATHFMSPGIGADLVATRYGFSREACDDYAVLSQQRAAAARDAGRFAASMVPVRDMAGDIVLKQDETIRAGATAAKLASMEPAFAAEGEAGGDARLLRHFPELDAVRHVHHAGNSPCMADGAALVLLASGNALQRHGLRPRARIVAVADACVPFVQTGAVEATQKALQRAGLTLGDIDLFEVRDSFAAVTLHYIDTLGIDIGRFNVNGSSIALGHPMGATGAMLMGTALDELERVDGRYAVVAIPGAAGVAVAMVVERI
ncbi:acetyl-CoA C-acyltransferase [Cupriavidus pinatubonensis]|uniref:Acyltransferase n=1 Tax=Cupriavidus pinatubonensis TaxID=248026 RepID=A0ABN7Z9A9_9BURK|nr:acetyl-CoA C-acyltransferase [Cupriavidus pinatubonensis]CAG9180956.1 Putative acyltransferase [Cupriavidus pinatubonensis]